MDDINVDDIADELASSGMMSAEIELDGFASHAPSDDTLGMNLLINPKKKLDVVEDDPIPEEEEPAAYETMPGGVPAPDPVIPLIASSTKQTITGFLNTVKNPKKPLLSSVSRTK